MGGLGEVRLIGRDAQSAQLLDAMTLASQGHPQLALVLGDAGIGKTAVVSDLVSRASELGFATAVGHCLDIEAAMSFAPAIEAVRTLVAGDVPVDGRPHARRMRMLLDPSAPEPDRVRMLDDLRLTILEAAADGPVLLVVEDVHWADRSTQDLVSAVARTARGHLLLVVTVRNDELHRRHPFRRTLAELSRLESARRVDLGPLDRDQVAELVQARSGAVASADTVTAIHERSEGNPLYAEELIDADPRAVPEHLSDLLLARVARLATETRNLVRTASVDGSLLDTDLLAAVSGHDADTVEQLLRPALDDHVLRRPGDVLEFRHGLVREAVYDDLLPGERTRIHTAFAEALQARVDADPEASLSELSRLAFHWSEAHDAPRTLAASVRAGERALHFGTAEAVTHLERAMSLLDRVPDAEAITGQAKPDMLLLLARAYADNEQRELFERLTREAVTELRPETHRLVASRVYATLTICEPAEGDLDDAEALRLALEYAGTTPSPELAQALCSQSSYQHRHGHGTPALKAARQAARVARQVGAHEHEVQALHFCAIELDLLGEVGEAIAAETEAVRVARGAGRLGHALFAESNLAWFELVGGAGDRAYDRGIAGLEESLTNGLPVLAVFCGPQAFASLVWHGRFDDAERLLERLLTFDVDTHWSWREELRQELAVARGEVRAVEDRLGRPPRFVESGAHHGGDETDVDQRVSLLLNLGRDAAARDLADAYLTFVEVADSPIRHACAAYTAYRAAAAQRDEDLRAHADRALDWARPYVTEEWATTLHGLRFGMADAFSSRFRGESATASLRRAVGIGGRLGAFVALEPRLMLAEDLLAHGDRDEGRELLAALWSDARDMGAGDHERRAFRLATRTRVPLPRDPRDAGPLSRLTPREREVLDLLADGATNRAIADTLFITEKTASVHVSNLLAKLGVPNRGAAAALARRPE
jgi:DNA-binding CsgD family transcriptional regulator